MTLFYPDCSNNNWAAIEDAINFLQQLVPQGFSGICHKVSEGRYYEDPYWPAVKQWCEQHNLPVLGYHYVTTDDPAAQARTWEANQGGGSAMLDWETNSGDLATLIAVVDAGSAARIGDSLDLFVQQTRTEMPHILSRSLDDPLSLSALVTWSIQQTQTRQAAGSQPGKTRPVRRRSYIESITPNR